MRNVSLRVIVGQLLTLSLLAPAIASAQSANITGYVLLAEDSIRAKRLTVVDGDLGVTNGLFSSRTSLAAPESDVAAGLVKFSGNTSCDALFANAATGTTSSCQNPTAFTNPFPDLADSCGYPEQFPACNAAAPITVTKGQTLTLPPGVYGDVKVEGGSGPKASLILSGQTTICNLQASRAAKIHFEGPSTLNVTGVITLSNAVEFGPAPGTGADDIEVFVAGTRVKASRRAKVAALLCAPNARFSAGTSAELEGRFVAKSIRLKRNRVSLAGMMPPTTTTTIASTTTTVPSTTSTTIPGSVCGNGIVEPGEECDGDVVCEGSAGGSFVDCSEQCTILETGPCGSTTTSTTLESTTTTVASTTTTTTLDGGSTTTTVPSSTTTTTVPSVCGNGIVEPGEQCDGDVVCEGSAGGSFVDCSEQCTIIETGPCGTTTTSLPASTTTTVPTTTSTTLDTTTTTVPSSTTTTTLPSVCGNGIVEPGEECDGDVACEGSAGGSFVDCSEQCTIIETGPCGTTTTSIPGSTTTTTEVTTTTTTTTTTTLPSVCGNGILEPGEECDGDVVCEGSAGGSFVDCSEQCTILETGPCGSTTTSTTTPSSSTTTTPTSTTTTTTIDGGPVCGNGIVEEGEACDDENTNGCDGCAADCSATEGCGNGVLDPACDEVCDGQDFGDATCPGGSPGGALLECSETCDSIDTSNCQPLEVSEICGNCIDDDENGLTDFEDPACCDGPQAFLGTLRRSNLKPKKNSTSQSFLRVKSTLATAGLMPSPMNEDVFLQIRDSSGTEILCAKVPAGKFMMMGKKKTFKFWDRKHMIASAQNIDDMKVSIKKNGTIKYAAYGKRVNVKTPAAGSLMVTVGFRDPSVGDSSNRCSSVTQPYRAGKKGAIRFP